MLGMATCILTFPAAVRVDVPTGECDERARLVRWVARLGRSGQRFAVQAPYGRAASAPAQVESDRAREVERMPRPSVISAVVDDRDEIGQLDIEPPLGTAGVAHVGDRRGILRQRRTPLAFEGTGPFHGDRRSMAVVVEQPGERGTTLRLGIHPGTTHRRIATSQLVEPKPAGSVLLEEPEVQQRFDPPLGRTR